MSARLVSHVTSILALPAYFLAKKENERKSSGVHQRGQRNDVFDCKMHAISSPYVTNKDVAGLDSIYSI